MKMKKSELKQLLEETQAKLETVAAQRDMLTTRLHALGMQLKAFQQAVEPSAQSPTRDFAKAPRTPWFGLDRLPPKRGFYEILTMKNPALKGDDYHQIDLVYWDGEDFVMSDGPRRLRPGEQWRGLIRDER